MTIDGISESDSTFTRSIAHYYGDPVRALFILCAAAAMISIPLFGHVLMLNSSTEVLLAILLVLLAGLTNPHGRAVLLLDALVAALGIYAIEQTAISRFSLDSSILFTVREVCALTLVFAFYFSVKTVRAMTLHRIGRRAQAGEFDE